jgi:hypothetical protein
MDEKKRKVGKEEVPVKVVQGRTEKVLECMPEKVIEKIHKMETTRVQPIVHRDRYQVEVHQIVQPIVEKVKKATVLEVKQPITQHLGTRLVEATFTPTLAEGSAIGQVAVAESRSDVVSMVQRTEELPPVIEETVHRKIIEKITPLILKEVVIPNLTVIESLPEGVLEAQGIHTEVGAPVVIEKLVIRSGTESIEERLQRLEAKQKRKAEKRKAKELLKLEKRASKLELKAQKQAAKEERQALKKVFREQELVTQAELALLAAHERQRQEREQAAVKVAAESVPAVLVGVGRHATQREATVDLRESEELPTPVEVVTTVDEVVMETTTVTDENAKPKITATLTDNTLKEAGEKLKNFTPMIVTKSDSQKELEKERERQEGKSAARGSAKAAQETRKQVV